MSNNATVVNKSTKENNSGQNTEAYTSTKGQANPTNQTTNNPNSQSKNGAGANNSIPKPKSIGNYILGRSSSIYFNRNR